MLKHIVFLLIINMFIFLFEMKLLFVCHQNVNRSKTAERIFKEKYETRSAGAFVFNTNSERNPLKKEDLEWADLIVVMEEPLRKEISLRFPDIYLK